FPVFITFLYSILPPPPASTLFPYTTLFRSCRLNNWQLGIDLVQSCARRVRNRVSAERTANRQGHEWETALRDRPVEFDFFAVVEDRKSTRLNSSHVKISYAVFCLNKKKKVK